MKTPSKGTDGEHLTAEDRGLPPRSSQPERGRMTPDQTRAELQANPLDFRAITRDADRAMGALVFDAPVRGATRTFLRCGALRIRTDGRRPFLDAYLGRGATDFEEDAAFAFRIPLLSISYLGTRSSVSEFSAVIDPRDSDELRVPGWGYDPFALAKTRTCEHCRSEDGEPDPHPIVPEGFYVPPGDPLIVSALAGMPITVVTGPA